MQQLERGVLLDETLARVADAFRPLIPFDRIDCSFLEEDATRLVTYWVQSTLGALKLNPGFARALSLSSLEQVLATGEPRVVDDLQRFATQHPESVATRRLIDEGGRSSLAGPLVVDGVPIGFLSFTSGALGAYTSQHQALFREVAPSVSAVVAMSRAYEQLVAHNRTLIERNQRLQVVATTDPLTGVMNRRAIDHVLQRAWLKHVQERTSCGVILADIDHFKAINDQWGHASGDAALGEFTRRIAGQLRKDDACGRYGGEEFLVVVSGVTEEQLLQTADRLRRAISREPFAIGPGIIVTASFGAAHTALGVPSPAELLGASDRALYEAKNDGRNRVRLATSP